jgi:hypothetical protein
LATILFADVAGASIAQTILQEETKGTEHMKAGEKISLSFWQSPFAGAPQA